MRFAVLFFAALVPVMAQKGTWLTVQALSSGTEVRVTTSGAKPVRGQIQSATADSLIPIVKNSQRVFTSQEATRASVKKKGHRGRNALIGLGIGVATG